MNNNLRIATEVVEHVGGKENISNLYHCMTRLRLNLKNADLFQSEKIKEVKGVLGVHISNGEFQIIIGPTVNAVYNEMLKLTELEATEQLKENLDNMIEAKRELSPKGIFNAIIKVFSACMNPLVPIFVLMGMTNVIAFLISPSCLNLVAVDSNIYYNFYWVGQAVIYFLPIFIAVTASRAFKANVFLSLVLASILLYPDLVSLMAAEGAAYSVYGIPALTTTYSASVIPIILIVWVQSYIEKLITKFSPNAVKVITIPMFTILIMLPISLCVLGPLGDYIGAGMSQFIIWLYEVAGPVETTLVAAVSPFLLAFGIGRPIFFICLTTLLTTGSEFAYLPIAMVVSSWTVLGGILGYIVKIKESDQKQLGITCIVADLLGGVLEPALFGILIPNRKMYLPVILGGAFSGLYVGIMKVGMYQFGPSNALNVIGFMGGKESNFVHGCIACAIEFLLSFILTVIMFKREDAKKNQ